MYKKEEKAYFTVEASLIMPLILGGIIFTIYLGLYLYDVCVIKQAAYIAALRGSQLADASTGEIEIYVDRQLEKLLGNQILAKRCVEQAVNVTANKVKVKINANIKMPFAEFVSAVTGLWEIESSAEADRVNPVNIIRNVRKINDNPISK